MLIIPEMALDVNVAFGPQYNPNQGCLPAKFLEDPIQWAKDLVTRYGDKDIQVLFVWNLYGVWKWGLNTGGLKQFTMTFDAVDMCAFRLPHIFEQIPYVLGILRAAFPRVVIYHGELSKHIGIDNCIVWVNGATGETTTTPHRKEKGWRAAISPYATEIEDDIYWEWFERQVSPALLSGCDLFTGTSEGLSIDSNRYRSMERLRASGRLMGVEPVPRADHPHMAWCETWSRQAFVEGQEKRDIWPRLPFKDGWWIGMRDSEEGAEVGDILDRIEVGWKCTMRPRVMDMVIAA